MCVSYNGSKILEFRIQANTMSSCWMNKSKYVPLCLVWVYTIYWLTSNAMVWEIWFYLYFFEEHETFNFTCSSKWEKASILSVGKSLKEYCSKASMLYALNDNALKDFLNCRRIALYSEVLMPKPVHILWGDKMNEFVKCFIAWQASDLPQYKERLKPLSKADVSLFVWLTDLF